MSISNEYPWEAFPSAFVGDVSAQRLQGGKFRLERLCTNRTSCIGSALFRKDSEKNAKKMIPRGLPGSHSSRDLIVPESAEDRKDFAGLEHAGKQR